MDGTAGRPAGELAAMIRRGEVSSRDVVDDHLGRIDAVNPVLNAVVHVRADAARAEAAAADDAVATGAPLGPLHGVPVTIKDCFGVTGEVCAVGTTGWAGRVATGDDPGVARLRRAGAIVVGVTNCPELLLAYESDNLVYGRTANPHDPTRTCGGSSGGEAAIVAAGGSPLGLGSDSGGSIRVPAHFCGVAGCKPTLGRVPMTSAVFPIAGLTSRFRGVGPIAGCVDDLVLALSVLAGPDGRDPYAAPVALGPPGAVDLRRLRAALYSDNGIAPCTSETVAAVETAGAALAAAGVAVEAAAPPGTDEAGLLFDLWGADGGTGVRRLLERAGTTEPSPLLAGFLAVLAERARTTAELTDLLARADRLRVAMLAFLDDHDLVIAPVAAGPAVPHGTTLDVLDAFSYSWPYNLTGWPVVVVRAGVSPEGLPIGVQLVAGPWREDVAFAAARTVEAAAGPWLVPSDPSAVRLS
jgi:amidase